VRFVGDFTVVDQEFVVYGNLVPAAGRTT